MRSTFIGDSFTNLNSLRMSPPSIARSMSEFSVKLRSFSYMEPKEFRYSQSSIFNAAVQIVKCVAESGIIQFVCCPCPDPCFGLFVAFQQLEEIFQIKGQLSLKAGDTLGCAVHADDYITKTSEQKKTARLGGFTLLIDIAFYCCSSIYTVKEVEIAVRVVVTTGAYWLK